MSDKRRNSKAQRELEETKILVDYLLAHGLDFDDIENFTEQTVKRAKAWFNESEDGY